MKCSVPSTITLVGGNTPGLLKANDMIIQRSTAARLKSFYQYIFVSIYMHCMVTKLPHVRTLIESMGHFLAKYIVPIEYINLFSLMIIFYIFSSLAGMVRSVDFPRLVPYGGRYLWIQ